MKILKIEKYQSLDSFDDKYRLVVSEDENEKVFIDNIQKVEIPFMIEKEDEEDKKELKTMSNTEKEIYKSFCETLLDMIERIATGKKEG